MTPYFPVNTIFVMRGCSAAGDVDVQEKYIDVIFDAMWAKGMNIGKEHAVKKLLSDAGLNSDFLRNVSTDNTRKEKLKESTEKAFSRDCFGAPTMFLGDQVFFGQDRIEFVKDALSGTH